MKIKKQEFVICPRFEANIENIVQRVIEPFTLQIESRNLRVKVAWRTSARVQMKADWDSYQLVLFNIVQNAVKYNNIKGDLIVVMNCSPLEGSTTSRNEVTYIFETEVIDSGIGISQERQKMLFEAFLELKIKQNFNHVQDKTIGVGLSCSRIICKALGGDITLKQSKNGITNFAFKIPVKIKSRDVEHIHLLNSQLRDLCTPKAKRISRIDEYLYKENIQQVSPIMEDRSSSSRRPLRLQLPMIPSLPRRNGSFNFHSLSALVKHQVKKHNSANLSKTLPLLQSDQSNQQPQYRPFQYFNMKRTLSFCDIKME